jgi:hypothetical protein
MHIIRFAILTSISLLVFVSVQAQTSPLTPLPLDDMSAFREQAGNWQIVRDVFMDPTVDIHHPVTTPAPAPEAKKGKKVKQVPAPPAPQAVTFQPGTGVLLNMNDDKKKSHLITNLQHGDIELELELMLPKGSNSGIYLQGRYEVQLFDSWGERNPKFSDIGGVYRNWEKEPGKIYMGKAPLSNPSKAPGLWQKMRIVFHAPRFDASGKKIANARFVLVQLNGVTIHDNVEVPLPTGGPLENNETAKGPLMIQGDHGPVAFRNIRYMITSELTANVSKLSYKAYKGRFNEVAAFESLKPVKSGTMGELTCEVLDDEDEFGLTYQGTIEVPRDDRYQFMLAYAGGGVLVVNGQTIIDFQRGDSWRQDIGSLDLKAGLHSFTIHYLKAASWLPPRLGLSVKTMSSSWVNLHAYNSFPPDDNPVSPIFINAGTQPRVLRAFVDFKGDPAKRITHSVGVGNPCGVNYVYDLSAGNVACVWRGHFVDATPMWHDRGDGSFKPMGATQFTYQNQALAFLSQPLEPFPATGKEGEFRSKGYAIDEKTGLPIFRYLYNGLEVEEKVYPALNDRVLMRELLVKNVEGKTNLYLKLAEGSRIDKMPDGSFAIDDRQYYIQTPLNATVREVNGVKELIAPVQTNSITFSIIW